MTQKFLAYIVIDPSLKGDHIIKSGVIKSNESLDTITIPSGAVLEVLTSGKDRADCYKAISTVRSQRKIKTQKIYFDEDEDEDFPPLKIQKIRKFKTKFT